MPSKFRFLILFLTFLIWVINGFYAFYVNRLKMEQFKLSEELRKLRKENDFIYYQITQLLNYPLAREEAYKNGFVDVKPYTVVNFWDTLKAKPLVDFYVVWFGDTLSKISEKLGVPLKEIKELNPSTRWGYIIPGMRLKIPVHFPYVEGQINATLNGTSGQNSTLNGTRPIKSKNGTKIR